MSFICISRYEAPPQIEHDFKDTFVFDLFLEGKVRPEILFSTLYQPHYPSYYIKRDACSLMWENVTKTQNIFLFTSSLGNGKSLAVEGVCLEAVTRGYTVYCVFQENDGLLKEISTIAKQATKRLIVIEDVYRFLEAVDGFLMEGPTNFVLLLTARSASHELRQPQLQAVLGDKKCMEIDLDRLTSKDLSVVLQIWNSYGFWGEKAAWPDSKKLKFLEWDCGAEMRSILLETFKAPVIKTKIDAILNVIMKETQLRDALVLAMVLPVAQYKADAYVIGELLNNTKIQDGTAWRNTYVREFMLFHRGQMFMNSPVLALHLLHQVAEKTDLVVKVLAKAIANAEVIAKKDKFFRNLQSALFRFGIVERILPDKRKKAMLLELYESIKNLPTLRTSPDFWLQYAIASLAIPDFDRSRLYFANAYSYASRRPTYPTYRIDNHFARYLLVSRMHGADREDYFVAFIEANRLLYRQMISEENGYYPYRVASLYKDYKKEFWANMNEKQRKIFLTACRNVVLRIEAAGERLAGYRVVRDCRDSLKNILATSI